MVVASSSLRYLPLTSSAARSRIGGPVPPGGARPVGPGGQRGGDRGVDLAGRRRGSSGRARGRGRAGPPRRWCPASAAASPLITFGMSRTWPRTRSISASRAVASGEPGAVVADGLVERGADAEVAGDGRGQGLDSSVEDGSGEWGCAQPLIRERRKKQQVRGPLGHAPHQVRVPLRCRRAGRCGSGSPRRPAGAGRRGARRRASGTRSRGVRCRAARPTLLTWSMHASSCVPNAGSGRFANAQSARYRYCAVISVRLLQRLLDGSPGTRP